MNNSRVFAENLVRYLRANGYLYVDDFDDIIDDVEDFVDTWFTGCSDIDAGYPWDDD
jgi:hypothetical protein